MTFKIKARQTFYQSPIPAELTAHDQKFQRLISNRDEAKLVDGQLAQLEQSGGFSTDQISAFKQAIRSTSTDKTHHQILEILLEKTSAGESFQSILDWILGNQQP